MSNDTRKETDKVNESLNQTGNVHKDFTERVDKGNAKSKSSFDDLFKSIKGGLGFLTLAGLGTLAGSTAFRAGKESAEFSEVINRSAVRTGENEFERAEFRNALLAVSARTNVDEDQLAAAAENAIALKASTDEAVKFAEVIGQVSKVFQGIDPTAFSEQIARDIRARGEQVTGETARRSVEALITGTRQGLGDIQKAFEAVSALPGKTQQRAGLSQRDLINLFAGAQGVAADPQIVNEAIRSLIKATDTIESRAAVQGVLGTRLRDAEGKFSLTAENLDDIAAKLKGIGDEAQQRAVLQGIPGFTPEVAEGILSLVKDRLGFQRDREKAERDQPKLTDAFQIATSGFLEKVSSFFNQFSASFKRDTRFEERKGRPGFIQDFFDESRKEAKKAVSPLALPGDLPTEESPTTRQRNRKPGATDIAQKAVEVKLTIEKVPEGFKVIPKIDDLPTTPGGFE